MQVAGQLCYNAEMQAQLPQADPIALTHSNACAKFIRHKIKAQDGSISFADYMQLALYAPSLGYYVSGTTKFGEAGDFITAPEISPLFGGCVARFCQRLLQSELADAEIVEFGAGSGRLAYDVLSFLHQWDCLPSRYAILDLSPDLKAKQKLLLESLPKEARDCVVWLNQLPQDKTPRIFLANEVLDAMPVHRVLLTPEESQEYVVEIDEHDQFKWGLKTITSEILLNTVKTLRKDYLEELDRPYTTEINLNIQPWLQSLADACGAGYVLLCDYGFEAHEYYHPSRYMGTLMCHYRHHSHDEPFYLPGLQDITAHVDFSAVAASANNVGWEVADFTNQAGFLIEHGVEGLFAELAHSEREQYELAQALKKLTLPHEMGELFKVMILKK